MTGVHEFRVGMRQREIAGNKVPGALVGGTPRPLSDIL